MDRCKQCEQAGDIKLLFGKLDVVFQNMEYYRDDIHRIDKDIQYRLNKLEAKINEDV